MERKSKIKRALKAAFPRTIPIMTGFLFLGAAYGIYARGAGLPAAVPIIMAAVVFAGSMEFVAVDMMTAGAVFDPLGRAAYGGHGERSAVVLRHFHAG